MFAILRLVGIDLPARISALEEEVGRRAEAATGLLKRATRQAAMIAALGAAAVITALLIFVTGLIALYVWVADEHGPYIGLAVVAGTLLVVTVILLLVARSKTRGLADMATIKRPLFSLPERAERRVADRVAGAVDRVADRVEDRAERLADRVAELKQDRADPLKAAKKVPDDGVESLATLVDTLVRFPVTGHPIADLLLRQLGPSTKLPTEEAIVRASNLVRHGDRTTMIGVLAAAAIVGYLLGGRQAPRRR
jgi:cell division septum initiation protein DivIVA